MTEVPGLDLSPLKAPSSGFAPQTEETLESFMNECSSCCSKEFSLRVVFHGTPEHNMYKSEAASYSLSKIRSLSEVTGNCARSFGEVSGSSVEVCSPAGSVMGLNI